MYAVVDIETTGGHASSNSITEIAIVLHDGKDIVEVYETLINPQQPIPYFIQNLTGITNEMVAEAPLFTDVAAIIFEKLQGQIFVAHNVNFDYSFVRQQLFDAGYNLKTKKLCTIRAARKILPDLPAYGLGKITRTLNITHNNKHRAASDAIATAELLGILLREDHHQEIGKMLYDKNREQYLPPNVPTNEVSSLPSVPGVYYFHNKSGQVIYIGKAVNLRKRVQSHFSNNKTGKTKQLFLREINHISYQTCGSDLIACLVESAEIRAKWPIHNRSQRGFQPLYGLIMYEDISGKLRLAVERLKKNFHAIFTFNTLYQGKHILNQLMRDYQLCPTLLKLAPHSCCHLYYETPCSDNCVAEDVATHNEKVRKAITSLKESLPTFAYSDAGRTDNEHSYILVNKGQVTGIGYTYEHPDDWSLHQLEEHATLLMSNDYMRNLVYKKAMETPHQLVHFKDGISVPSNTSAIAILP